MKLLDLGGLGLEGLALNQVRNLVIVGLSLLAFLALCFLQVLVAFGQLAKRSQGIGAKLVQDAGNELRKLLVLSVSKDGEGVGWY
jgi:hypothetical protein